MARRRRVDRVDHEDDEVENSFSGCEEQERDMAEQEHCFDHLDEQGLA